MYGMGENYLSALAVYLGYSALQISILHSVPQFIGSFVQLFSNQLLALIKSQKQFVVVLSYFHAFLWLVLVGILVYLNNYYMILIWMIIYFIVSFLINPVWISWIGYIVPRQIRGTYHGIRNRNINSFVLIAILLGGYILDLLDKNLMYGFFILFTISFVGRFLSSYFLEKKDDYIIDSDSSQTSYMKFLNNKLSRHFIIFKFMINFSIMFLGSLFAIYILRSLNMNNLVLGYCGASWWLGNIVSSKYWGKLSKKSGYISILKSTTFYLMLLPIAWILVFYISESFKLYIILSLSFIAGITFSGFSLSSFNIVYEIVEKSDVVRFTSLLRFSEGLGILISSVLAGMIVDSLYINKFLIGYNFSSIQLSMSISMILRIYCYFYIKKYEETIIIKSSID